jgi:hypothetical protein
MSVVLTLNTPQLQKSSVALLRAYGLNLIWVEKGLPIPFSYFGAPEAGIYKNNIFARQDTPLHSLLHESSHVICMESDRRVRLASDANGDFIEENCVLFLQIILAKQLGLSENDICQDMDSWGYSFRLGSALAWYKNDANECMEQLITWGILDHNRLPTYLMRR